MKYVKDFVRWFFYITTAVLLICAFHFGVAGDETLPKGTLWQILLSGFLTTAVTVILCHGVNAESRHLRLRFLLHYLALCAVMILSGHSFGWLEYDVEGILMMVVSVAVVYLICFGVYFLMDMGYAGRINRGLREKYGEKE